MTAGLNAKRLARFSLTTADADRLASFYEQALGCKRIGVIDLRGNDFDDLLGVRGGARCITLALGQDTIELLEFEYTGSPYPPHSSASDLIFQHLAIVVADMTEAWFRLSRIAGWSPITHGLPQRLPESSGGVTAFKFRDPEGHPLEFLSFPTDKRPQRWRNPSTRQACQGIDHSAISVANAAISREFYETLGLHPAGQSSNAGPEQDALDGISAVHVDVVALTPEQHTPHVELLCYGSGTPSRIGPLQSNDIACTRLVFDVTAEVAQRLSDPDGHQLILLPDAQLRRPSHD